MTIPALINNINDIRFRSQLFKSYSLLQQTIKRMEADDITITPSTYTGNDRKNNSLYSNFGKYFTNATDCGDEAYDLKLGQECLDRSKYSYYSFRGNSRIDKQYFDDGQILMPDGSLIIFEQPADARRIWIWIDVNGIKPPNRLGYDLFVFQITDDGLKPMGDIGTKYEDTDGSEYCNKSGTGVWNGMSCTYKAVHNSDYFKWIKRVKD